MAGVYKICRLMLSATDSANSDWGLFTDRCDDVLFMISEQVSRRCGLPKGTFAHSSRLAFDAVISKGAYRKGDGCFKNLFWRL